ncbi:MAG: hypothetical protein F7C38_00035 [Desulfurococcales archaeon]|nr:hypothetical protein [Desulfurococcales archaeon]
MPCYTWGGASYWQGPHYYATDALVAAISALAYAGLSVDADLQNPHS